MDTSLPTMSTIDSPFSPPVPQPTPLTGPHDLSPHFVVPWDTQPSLDNDPPTGPEQDHLPQETLLSLITTAHQEAMVPPDENIPPVADLSPPTTTTCIGRVLKPAAKFTDSALSSLLAHIDIFLPPRPIPCRLRYPTLQHQLR